MRAGRADGVLLDLAAARDAEGARRRRHSRLHVEHGRHLSLQSDALLDTPRGARHAAPAPGRLRPLPAAPGDGRGRGTRAAEHGLPAHAPGGRDDPGCDRARRWPGPPGLGTPSTLYLTTTGRRTGRPREIEIWFTQRGGRYYLVAELRERAQWVQNLRVAPRVAVRVGRRSFAALSRVVDAKTEPELARAVRKMSEKKYGWGNGLVVELDPA